MPDSIGTRLLVVLGDGVLGIGVLLLIRVELYRVFRSLFHLLIRNLLRSKISIL